MATLEWIEWGPGFARKREVVGIARILSGEKCPEFQGTKSGQIGGQVSPRQTGRHEVAARFMEVMEWADHETTDGRILGATPELVDELAGLTGFAHALNRVGWLMQIPGGIEFVNFTYHNGKSSKSRKSAALKKKMQRLGESDVPKVSPKSRDKNGTEPGTTVPDRTSSNTPIPPLGSGPTPKAPKPTHSRAYTPQFTEAWQAYPSVGREKKPLAFKAYLAAVERLEAGGYDAAGAMALIRTLVGEYARTPKGKSGFAGHMATWLNGDPWDTPREAWQRGDSPKDTARAESQAKAASDADLYRAFESMLAEDRAAVIAEGESKYANSTVGKRDRIIAVMRRRAS